MTRHEYLYLVGTSVGKPLSLSSSLRSSGFYDFIRKKEESMMID